MIASRRVLASLLGFVLIATPAHATAPVEASIRISDGSLDDWAQVLTNPLNAARDGEGSTIDCAFSTDADCPIPAPHLDLERFAWTWDDDSLFLYINLHACPTASDVTDVRVYLDTDRDALMELDEPVVVFSVGAAHSALAIELYSPASPGGDPLVDPAEQADGHPMAGTLVPGAALWSVAGAPPTSATFELAVPWTALGLAPRSAMDFHVGVADDGAAQDSDNMGGVDGGIGTTAYACIGIDTDSHMSSAPGATLLIPHEFTNDGNTAEILELEALSLVGHDITYWRDVDGNGTADIYLGHDDGGDGVFSLPGDDLDPAGDSDSDGFLDTGLLEPGEVFYLILQQDYPLGTAGVIEELDVAAWIKTDPETSAESHDVIRIGEVTIVASSSRSGSAGDVVWFPHVVQNNTDDILQVDISVGSALAWPYTIHLDTGGNANPEDASDPLTDTDASGAPDVQLTPGQGRDLFARASVPAGAPLGLVETAIVRAEVDGIPTNTVTDRSLVAEPVDVFPGYLQAEGRALHGGPGLSIYFAHQLKSSQSIADTFSLEAVSDQGWPTTIFSDDDGDGRPYDSQVLPGRTPIVSGNGASYSFIVRVTVPEGAGRGDSSRITVTATSWADPAVSDAVIDDAVSSVVRVYEDPGHVVNSFEFEPCSTSYAQASGLAPSSPGYRFVWRDSTGAAIQVTDTATDALGVCEDSRMLAPDEQGSDFSVEILQDDGSDFVSLDTAWMDVMDLLTIDSLAASAPSYHISDSTLLVTAELRNISELTATPAIDLRWVVKTPTGDSYLQGSGTFQPYDGDEATLLESISLAPRETHTADITITDVDYLEAGTHVVEIWQTAGCGEETLGAMTSFEVVDDEDGDGLSRMEELAASTDPQDADTDNDGLLDGEDGLNDSDSDGLIDALDCDSDDDGLTDGLEAGIWDIHADTEPGACLMVDLWPLSTTDPDIADTDGGGVPDGVEDKNANGRVDADEGDPRQPSDDSGLCSFAVPAEASDLRVNKEGDALRINWAGVFDDCRTSRVYAADALPGLTTLVDRLLSPTHVDPAPLSASRVRYYVAAVDSYVTGPGPTGH